MQCIHISTYINTWMIRKVHKFTYIHEISIIKNITFIKYLGIYLI